MHTYAAAQILLHHVSQTVSGEGHSHAVGVEQECPAAHVIKLDEAPAAHHLHDGLAPGAEPC